MIPAVPSLEDVILHLPSPAREAFGDPEVDHVMLNPDGSIWEARGARVDRIGAPGVSAADLKAAAEAIAAAVGIAADAARPIGHADLPDGSGVAITSPPVCAAHAITVRRGAGPC